MKQKKDKLPVIVVVDASPRWLYGITELESSAYGTRVAISYGYQLEHLRLTDLMCETDPEASNLDKDSPVHATLSVELKHIDDVKWSRYRGHPLYLCGLYGDQCVTDAAKWLRSRGFRVTILIDASLWGDDFKELQADGKLEPGIHYDTVVNLLPDIADQRGHIWTNEIPYT